MKKKTLKIITLAVCTLLFAVVFTCDVIDLIEYGGTYSKTHVARICLHIVVWTILMWRFAKELLTELKMKPMHEKEE